MAGEELFSKYQTIIYLAGSASAEFFADMALAPFEAVKVRKCTLNGCGKGPCLRFLVSCMLRLHVVSGGYVQLRCMLQ